MSQVAVHRLPDYTVSHTEDGCLDIHRHENNRSLRAGTHEGNWQPQRNRNFRELLSDSTEHMLLNGAVALLFPQFALLHSVTCVRLSLIVILGNCGCVAVASFLGVLSPLNCITYLLITRR
jgi:hypothetical protein